MRATANLKGIIVAVGAALAVSACSGPVAGGSIATPPADASPEHVVQALIDAVNAGDVGLVQQLSNEGSSQFEDWIEDGATLQDAAILDLYTGPEQAAGTAFPDGVAVTVTFTPRGTDDSLPSGSSVTWNFLLTDESGRWLVFGAGGG